MFPLFFLTENLFLSSFLFLCSALMAAAEISSESGRGDYRATADGGKGLILIFQCGSEEVGCQVSEPTRHIEILLKNRVNCFAWEARKLIRFSQMPLGKVRISSYLVLLIKSGTFSCNR